MNASVVAARSRAHVGVEQRRGEALEQQRRRRGVAVVHLVAHVERLRHQRLQLDRDRCAPAPRAAPARASSAIQRRRSITSGPLAPKRSTLPSPSLRLQYARLPARPVLDDEHRHRRADDARPSARPRAWWWQGSSSTPPRSTRRARGVDRIRPAFEHDGAQDGAAHRPAHRRPRDRRPGVQDQPPAAAPCPASRRARARCRSSTGCASTKRANATRVGRFDARVVEDARRAPTRRRDRPAPAAASRARRSAPPAATTLSAKPARPTLITDSESLNSVFIGRLPRAPRAARPARRQRRRLDIAVGDDRAGRLELARLRRLVLRIAVGAADVADQRQRAALRARVALRVDQRFGEAGGGIGVRAEAQHDVEQRSPPSRGSAACARTAALRSDGSIIGCGRPRVYSSSPRSMKTWPLARRRVERRCAPSTGAFERQASPRCEEDELRLVAERAAGEQPAHGALRRRHRGGALGDRRRRAAPAAGAGGGGGARPRASATAHVRRVLQRVGGDDAGARTRRRSSRRGSARRRACPRAAASIEDRPRDRGCRRLGDQHDHARARVVGQRAQCPAAS